MKKIFTVYHLLWLVYILFLGVLMPHTAWSFAQFQQDKSNYNPLAWMLAFAVESVIAVFTHKFSEYLSSTKKRKGFAAAMNRLVNGYSVGLVMVLVISSIANLSYAVQFAGDLAVYAEWGISKGVYEFVFGAMLPFVSLVFALILSNMADTEQEDDPRIIEANATIKDIRLQLRQSDQARKMAEDETRKANDRANTVTDIAKMFLLPDKKERIIEIYKRWPQLPNSAIAQISEASSAHVSEVLTEARKN